MALALETDAASGLFARLKRGPSRSDLQQAAQLAIQVEFTTIPAYLTALYSIQEVDTPAYQLLRSVVMEEMFHINQAANLLVSIGGVPRFTGDFAPSYPTYLRQANPNTTPYIGLYRASPDVFQTVFAGIETPAPNDAPPQGTNYDTIAQLYGALRLGLRTYDGADGPLFKNNSHGRQRTDIYPGKFGGQPLLVSSLETADDGITQIVQQGEGTLSGSDQLIPIEPWGTYNHYGQRTDGTYGPIVGHPYEMSHFIKFRSVYVDRASFPATFPIVSNPRFSDFENKSAQQKATIFDIAYTIMLASLELTFHPPQSTAGVDPFFAITLPLMHKVLPDLARALMTTPTRTDGDGSVGPNAAPLFRCRNSSPLWEQVLKMLSELVNEINGLMDHLRQRTGSRDIKALQAELAPLTRARDMVTQLPQS